MADVPLVSIRNGMVTFGGSPLFSDLSCQILPGDRICLVGRNGCGKTTLLHMLAGVAELDGGEHYKAPNVVMGFLPQVIEFEEDQTIYDYILSAFEGEDESCLEHKRYLADRYLETLNLNGQKPMARISGGKQRRAALIRALVLEPNLLLLDEPTNHLDLTAIEWLEGILTTFRGGVVCISHDRAFLRTISNKTWWMDRGGLRTSPKGYENFDVWYNEVLEKESKDLNRLNKKMDAENLWLQQGVSARRKRNQQRLSSLYQLRSRLKEETSRFNKASDVIKLPPLSPEMSGKMVLEMDNISHAYHDVDPPKETFKNFSMRVLRGERIGLIGRNGAGKTTFLKILTGILSVDSGSVRLGTNVDIRYVDQQREELNPEETLWGTLCPEGGDTIEVGGQPRHVVSYLKDFMFDEKQARSPVSSLSGGEKNRLLLARMFANTGNFLILDEPTNDLDMDTLDMLQDMLSDYAGTLLIVSHDRDFLDRLVTRTLVFEDGKIGDYIGGYSDYLADRKEEKKAIKQQKEASKEPIKKTPTNQQLSYKIKRELTLLPDHMAALEQKIQTLEVKMEDPDFYHKDPEGFEETTQALKHTKEELEQAESRWLEIELMKEEMESK